MSTSRVLQAELADRLSGIQLIDTHEHLIPEDRAREMKPDLFFWFLHYASSDAVSSGMPLEALGALRRIPDKRYLEGAWSDFRSIPLEERWRGFSPYWNRIRNTAYAKAILIAARDLHGIEDLNDGTFAALSEKIARAYRPGYHAEVFRAAGIERAIVNLLFPAPIDRRLFLRVMRPDHLIVPRSLAEIRDVEKATGLSIHSIDDLEEAIERFMQKEIEDGCAGVKIGLAYKRCLRFEKTAKSEADRAFQGIFRDLGEGLSWQEAKPLQDYLVHRVIRFACERGLPVQIHTGLQEGNGNIITNSRPTDLVNLFLEYSTVRFDIFHGSYPYQSELGTLAKNFQNVYVDMCWLHVISPTVARNALHEWIETVPSNKIFGFGGDYLFVEGTYGHAKMARANIARVLAEKIQEGYLSEEEAESLGRKLLRENARVFFGLGEPPRGSCE